MTHDAEADAVRRRYERRKTDVEPGRYDPLRPANLRLTHGRERAIAELLRQYLGSRSLSDMECLEIGCGSGDNLLQMLRLGASPGRMQGNDLLEDRVAAARKRLPSALRLHEGNAVELPIADASLDIVMQFMVFSSILDEKLRKALAQRIMAWLKPGGAVLWYDFTVDNPRNPDVSGVKMSGIKKLFPGYALDYRRVTLAPPLARRIERFGSISALLEAVPFLRTHVVCMIVKPDAREAKA